MTLEKLQADLQREETALKNPKLAALMGDKIQAKIDSLKKQIAELQNKAEGKVEDAQQKVEDAKQKAEDAKTPEKKKEAKEEVKEAQQEVKEAKQEVKEVKDTADDIKKVEKKWGGVRQPAEGKRLGRPKVMRPSRPRGMRGGKRMGAGRKKASSPTKMKKPDGVKVTPMKRRVMKRKPMKSRTMKARAVKRAAMPVRKMKQEVKKVRAFGRVVEYRNDAEFCKRLISAFKQRRQDSKKTGKRKKTKPIFSNITAGVKNAVSRALHSVSKKTIEKNPKQFLAKAQRLEKSAIRFLEDFKSILGSDYKKSEITSEFGELEKSIKAFVAKYTKK